MQCNYVFHEKTEGFIEISIPSAYRWHHLDMGNTFILCDEHTCSI